MEYTIKQLADLSGLTPRALRYYDSIGLLRPQRQLGNDYRVYGREEVLRPADPFLPRAGAASGTDRQTAGWASCRWGEGRCTQEAHMGLVELYIKDLRFTEYYEKIAPGCAEFFVKAIHCYYAQ